MPIADEYSCDYLIIGGGAAGLSLAYHLAQEPRLDGKRIIVVEPEAVKANDRTWRYWAIGSTPFESIETHCWDKLVLRTPNYEQAFGLGSYRYRMVKAQDFYDYVHRALDARPAQFIRRAGCVIALIEEPNGVCVHLADGQTLRTCYAFDSRLPSLTRQPSRYLYLEQHFRGWEVETDYDFFDPDTVQFMDFRVPQHGQARFVYALPFSERRALVEFTVFSPHRLPAEEYKTELRRYLAEHLGGRPYRIVAEEEGGIPMTNHPLSARTSPHVVNLGTRAGRAKPSTGYTFARIQLHSARLVQALAATGHPPVDATGDRWQFRLFDTLLLDVIQRQGEQLGSIFSDLFRHNAVPQLFAFLDEQTSWRENIHIMRSVSPWPFLHSLSRLIWKKLLKEHK